MSYYVYIATNSGKTTLYTGITNDLSRRIFEHANKVTDGFTARYNINRIVWYDIFNTPYEAISAEKRIKGWRREKKVALIKEKNPKFLDLLHAYENAEDPS